MSVMKNPSWIVSLIPIAVLVALLVPVVIVFGPDSLSGASEVALLLASAVAAAISMLAYKRSWLDIELAIVANFRSVSTSLVILLMVGALSATWMLSGVVPFMIYYGMKLLSPSIFLFAACAISAGISLMTGSSWTTVATIGIAFVGIGAGLGFSPGWTAGAVISGAYFGDKISPLSDTTVLASSASGVGLFDHIRYMFITTVPSVSIALLVFLFASIFHTPTDNELQSDITEALSGCFMLSPWLLVVPVLTGVLIIRKNSPIITLFLGAFMALVAALIFQPGIIARAGGSETADLLSLFKGSLISVYGPTSMETGNEMLNGLVATRGMTGMLNTIFLVICSVTFGGVMTGSGMVHSITEAITRHVHTRTGVVASTVAAGISANVVTADQYLAILITSNLFGKLYKDNGYENRLLSRSVEDSATITSVLVPWNSCGMTQATVLNVSTLTYLPYCIFNLVSPLMSIIVAMLGYKIYRNEAKGDSRDAGEGAEQSLI
ncbi:MAG: sodium:proton antiporter [Bacteroidales bacterium]|nr:sodium:proton antiporter [Bacteroidales bacterium]